MEKLTILKDSKNLLLNRHEVQLVVKASVSPKTSEAQEFIAKEFSGVADNVEIIKIDGNFGSDNFTIYAHIYNSKEEKDKVENKIKKAKKSKIAK